MARKILLADDSVTAQNMGRKILADAGYEVIAVNNGSAALKKIAETKPDIIILDVYMPGYSGLEVCQRLKEAPETARVPVLLTVGKLEPFKPEEARRVRAEGYIVKPFEASELLSALSKLEDKIVPRPEPSKPGRFARANAAIDESKHEGRQDKSMASDEDSGWKNRIGFPSKEKKAPEAEENDDSTIYNAVNKDLRTVVDRKMAQESRDAKAAADKGKSEEARVDLGALAPEGLPKDVTPEEIAALAAAAAQVKGKLTDSAEAQTAPDAQAAETVKKELQTALEPATDSISATATFSAQKPDTAQKLEERSEGWSERLANQPIPGVAGPSPSEMTAAIAGQIPEMGKAPDASGNPASSLEGSSQDALKNGGSKESIPHTFASNLQPSNISSPGIDESHSGALKVEAAKDVAVEDPRNFRRRASDHAASEPVTMAAAAGVVFGGSTSRWTAVAVALGAGEAAVSLEHEMQKAHAAYAAADIPHSHLSATPEVRPEAAAAASSAESPLNPTDPAALITSEPAFAQSATAEPTSAEPVSAKAAWGEPADPAQTSSTSFSSSESAYGAASERETSAASEGVPTGSVANAETVPEERVSPAAASEASASAVKEFEKVVASNFAAPPQRSEVQEAAAVRPAEAAIAPTAETLPGPASPGAETESQDLVEAVSSPQQVEAGKVEAESTTADVAKENPPEPAWQKAKQISEDVTAHTEAGAPQAEAELRQIEEPAQFAPEHLKPWEPVGQTTVVVPVAESSAAPASVAKSGDAAGSNSSEPASVAVTSQAAEPVFTGAGLSEAATAAASSEPAAGGIKDMAKKESEISETTAAAWANWRRIRESGDGKSESKAATVASKSRDEEPVSARAGEPKDPAPPEAAMAVAAGAETSPEASAEEGSAALEDSGEIASIVDSVLAQMRPKIVEEISRKLGRKK